MVRETGLEPYSLNTNSPVITVISNLHVSFLRFSCLLFLKADFIALTIKGQRVILSAVKLDYKNKREEMLGHLTNDNRNHDVYIARYNAGKFVESIEKLM